MYFNGLIIGMCFGGLIGQRNVCTLVKLIETFKVIGMYYKTFKVIEMYFSGLLKLSWIIIVDYLNIF